MSARVSFSLAFLGGAILGGLIWLAQNVQPLLPLAVIAVVILALAPSRESSQ